MQFDRKYWITNFEDAKLQSLCVTKWKLKKNARETSEHMTFNSNILHPHSHIISYLILVNRDFWTVENSLPVIFFYTKCALSLMPKC